MSRKVKDHLNNKNSNFYEINQLELSINGLRGLLKKHRHKFNIDELDEIQEALNKTKTLCHKTRFELFRLKFMYSDRHVPNKKEFNESVLNEIVEDVKRINRQKKKEKLVKI